MWHGSDPLRVGLVGYGYWGRNYLRILNELEDVELGVVCDSHPARRAEVSRRHRGIRVTDSLDDLLGTPGLAAVIVSTPAMTHYEVGRRCLDAGKHILIEKPLTTDSGSGELLVKTAEDAGLTVLVGHTFLYNDAVLRLKEIIDGGELGELYCIYSRRTNLGPIRNDVNVLWDLGPHDIAVFDYLLGAQPLWVSGVGHRVLRRRLEDVGFVSLRYPGNVLGHLHVSWTDPHKVRETVVVGSAGRAVFDDLDRVEPVRIFYKGVHAVYSGLEQVEPGPQLVIRDGDIRSPKLIVDEPLKKEVLHFLDCVRFGTRPRTDGRFGVAVVNVMEAIDTSLAARGAPTAVNGRTPYAMSRP
jgi:predicted dehydrogenase